MRTLLNFKYCNGSKTIFLKIYLNVRFKAILLALKDNQTTTFHYSLYDHRWALISGHKEVRQLFRYTHLKPENLIAKYSTIF